MFTYIRMAADSLRIVGGLTITLWRVDGRHGKY